MLSKETMVSKTDHLKITVRGHTCPVITKRTSSPLENDSPFEYQFIKSLGPISHCHPWARIIKGNLEYRQSGDVVTKAEHEDKGKHGWPSQSSTGRTYFPGSYIVTKRS